MNILLLQGPLGPFYKILSQHLSLAGHYVIKVNFNGGDECWPCVGDKINYYDTPEEWDAFFRQILKKNAIDLVICYGDCRYYHRVAHHICAKKNIPFWVFEEGYLRPDFVTLEPGGVNAFSQWYEQRERLPYLMWSNEFKAPMTVGKTFAMRAWYASYYHINKALKHYRYPYFVNHRPWSLWQETMGWIKGAYVKYRHLRTDKSLLEFLKKHHAGHIFLVPLQVSEDFQIREHSDFDSIEQMIENIVSSFAKHASEEDVLLFKHHPMDRGYVSYHKCIERLISVYCLDNRIFYGFEIPLPKLYLFLKGVVTINSTVGFSALLHHVPTICLGRALYDISRLTTKGSLSSFWQKQDPVCTLTFNRVRNSLLHLTQLNASFYQHLNWSARAAIVKMQLIEPMANEIDRKSNLSVLKMGRE
ncbi:TPA: capsular biosynthesis protein [Escherichia coli]|nr:capsular biosynthesis protein [Escherichia coli]HBC9011485.1 capsular biosynthesis protein [Escherichia coli]